MKSDVQIAAETPMRPIDEVAEQLGFGPDDLYHFGPYKAKLPIADPAAGRHTAAKLVLMTAMSPTPAGEGKTTTSVGLADALRQIGERAVVCLREPSMGPVFGMKGGAAGGGYAQLNPMVDINLHFTGDFAAIEAAHNLLAAMLDNHLHQGNALDIDPRRVTWKRVVDTNDRALRDIVVGLGGATGGVPRESGFDIVVASEVMAIFCLATSVMDLRERLGRIIVARTRSGQPVTAADLKAHGAMTVLLKEALAPNLVQTLEGTPALVHGGPFANIAHGCNSVIATNTALKRADWVVTEAGFGADLGAEKFIDLKCRMTGLRPDVAVVVASVRALKYHGGVAVVDLTTENVEAVRDGMSNLERHYENLTTIFGLPVVVAVNRFPTDTDAEVAAVVSGVEALGGRCEVATHVCDGGSGAVDLARTVMETVAAQPSPDLQFTYADDVPLADKLTEVATRHYRAERVRLPAKVAQQLEQWEQEGYGRLPVCIAKTQSSFSADPALRGAPTGHVVEVREVRLAAGAGFIVAICGSIMTMPGLPKSPAAERIDLTPDGEVVGLF